jgi:hypothetical protein
MPLERITGLQLLPLSFATGYDMTASSDTSSHHGIALSQPQKYQANQPRTENAKAVDQNKSFF